MYRMMLLCGCVAIVYHIRYLMHTLDPLLDERLMVAGDSLETSILDFDRMQ